MKDWSQRNRSIFLQKTSIQFKYQKYTRGWAIGDYSA
jgi:hypothetical protein